MNIALVDDMDHELVCVTRMLKDYAREKGIEFNIELFKSGEEFLNVFQSAGYSIIFMDIYMNGMTGAETAKIIRERDNSCMIIFLTSSADHMSEAFSCHAFDYLLKPVSEDKLYKVVTEALGVLPKISKYIEFSTNRKRIRLLYSDLVCVETGNHKVIVTDRFGKTYDIRGGFYSFVEPLLQDDRFLLPFKGILVNMDYILEFQKGYFTLIGNYQFPVRIREQAKIEQTWRDYMFAKLREEQ